MGFDEVTFFGTLVKTHGIKGHLVLRCYDNFTCKKKSPAFLYIKEGDQNLYRGNKKGIYYKIIK